VVATNYMILICAYIYIIYIYIQIVWKKQIHILENCSQGISMINEPPMSNHCWQIKTVPTACEVHDRTDPGLGSGSFLCMLRGEAEETRQIGDGVK